MDRPIDATAAQQRLIGGVDDRVDVERRDVGVLTRNSVHGQIHFRQRKIASGISVVSTIIAQPNA